MTLEPCGDGFAALDRFLAPYQPAVRCEEIGHVHPEAELRVLGVDALQVLHRPQRLQPDYVTRNPVDLVDLVDLLLGR